MIIDGEKIINFQFYDEEHEEYLVIPMKIGDFLEKYSEETVPTIEETAQPDVPDKNVGDTISRQAATDAIDVLKRNYPSSCFEDLCKAVDIAIKVLSAQPERKRGKWEVCNILDYAQRPSGRKILRCPFCGYLTDEFRSRVDYYHKLTNFCPNCGAYMRGEQ